MTYYLPMIKEKESLVRVTQVYKCECFSTSCHALLGSHQPPTPPLTLTPQMGAINLYLRVAQRYNIYRLPTSRFLAHPLRAHHSCPINGKYRQSVVRLGRNFHLLPGLNLNAYSPLRDYDYCLGRLLTSEAMTWIYKRDIMG